MDVRLACVPIQLAKLDLGETNMIDSFEGFHTWIESRCSVLLRTLLTHQLELLASTYSARKRTPSHISDD